MEAQLKFGIYYSYWEQEWSADYLKYVEKVAKLGFDVIEIAAHHLNSYSPAHIVEVGRSARANGVTITAGLGPSHQRNLSSADPAVRKAGRAFFEETLTKLAKLDIRVIGGALHSYWRSIIRSRSTNRETGRGAWRASPASPILPQSRH
jgi:D-psicose/D-tagatose/L-ribulose 3-epimerase